MSQKLKFVLATATKLSVLGSKAGEVESTENLEGGATAGPIKLFPISMGYGIMHGNKIVVKKLLSSGKVDETFKPCQTAANLRDTIYELRNPTLIYALTETTNELILFSLQSSQADCQVVGKVPLTSINDRPVYDSITLLGSLLVARSTEDASLHLFLTKEVD